MHWVCCRYCFDWRGSALDGAVLLDGCCELIDFELTSLDIDGSGLIQRPQP